MDVNSVKSFGKKNNIFDRVKRYRIAFEIAAGILFLLIIYTKSNVYFETNDDTIISYLLSGSIISKPQIRIFDYVHVFETIPLVLLYKVIPFVPWYGLYILICHLLFIVLPINAISSRTNNMKEMIVSYISYGLILLPQWIIHSRIQYSSTAELLALAGFICFLFYKNRKCALISFIILEIMGYLMRYNAMLLMLPIGMSLFVLHILNSPNDNRKKAIKETAQALLLLVIVVVSLFLVSVVAYGSQKYREARTLNNLRMEIMDYNFVPEYADVKEILDRYNISENKYYALLNYNSYEWTESEKALEEIAEYVNNHNYERDKRLFNSFKQVWNKTLNYEFGKLSGVIIGAWILVFTMIVVYSKPSYLVVVGTYVVSKIISWGYLFYRGRVVGRVLLPLFVAENLVALSIMLSCILINKKKNDKSKKLYKVIRISSIIALLFFMLIMAFRSARNQHRYLYSLSSGYEYMKEYKVFIDSYCDNHSENAYILSSEIYNYWPASIKDTAKQKHNYTFSGGWYSLLPESREYTNDYCNSSENLYYICLLPEEYSVSEYNLKFLEEKNGQSPQLEDELELPTGARAGVYRLDANTINNGTASITWNTYRILATGPRSTVIK